MGNQKKWCYIVLWWLWPYALFSQVPAVPLLSPSESYRKYQEALKGTDDAAVKKWIVDEKLRKTETQGLSNIVEILRQITPADVQILHESIQGEHAELMLEGHRLGAKVPGKVGMKIEANVWKIVYEDWKLQLELAEQKDPSDSPQHAAEFLNGLRPLAAPLQIHLILDGHQSDPTSLVFTPDSRYLISVSEGDLTLRVWDAVSGKQTCEMSTEHRVRSMVLTSDGKHLITADAYLNVKDWKIENGIVQTPRIILGGMPQAGQPGGAGDEVAIDSKMQWIAVTTWKKPVSIYQYPDGKPIKVLGESAGVRKMVFSPDGSLLAGAGHGNELFLWKTSDWSLKTAKLAKVDVESDVGQIDFSPDGKYVGTAHMDSSIVLYDVKAGKEHLNFFVRDAATMAIRFAKNQSLFATAQNNQKIYLWESEKGQQIEILNQEGVQTSSLAFSPDGKTLATGGNLRKIYLWRTGPPSAPLPVAEEKKEAVASGGTSFEVFHGKKNHLINPSAQRGMEGWVGDAEVRIDSGEDGDPYFETKFNGSFSQDVVLPETAGKIVILVARVSHNRTEEMVGENVGLPYLWGLISDGKNPPGYFKYLNQHSLTSGARTSSDWYPVWGSFPIPADKPGVTKLNLVLKQADGSKPKNGSYSRFNDVGVFVLDSDEEARALIQSYKSREPSEAKPISSSTVTEPSPAGLEASLFTVSGVIGDVTSPDVVVTLNGNHLISPGQSFDLLKDGKSYKITLVSVSEDQVVLKEGDRQIIVKYE